MDLTKPAIEVIGLTKFYGKSLGIKDVSFAVEPGEIFGFLGANGAGKTTTIRLLLNLLRPDGGEIKIFGNRIDAGFVALRDRLGYLPGEFRPYVEMTALNYLNYMASFRMSPPQLREKLTQQFGLSRIELSQKIKYLSHGTRQKIGIIQALEHNPQLIILDEPTLGLDPLIQECFYQAVLDFQRQGKTVFLSSHILREIEKICQRVAIIRNGKIVALESIQELKAKRLRRLVIEFKTTDGFNPREIPGLQFLEQQADRFIYYIEGELRSVLAMLSQLEIADLVFPEPELENIFLAYYAENQDV